MPLATFRCADPKCGAQETVRLTDFHRREGKPDVMHPVPRHDGKPMVPIQIAYFDGGGA